MVPFTVLKIKTNRIIIIHTTNIIHYKYMDYIPLHPPPLHPLPLHPPPEHPPGVGVEVVGVEAIFI